MIRLTKSIGKANSKMTEDIKRKGRLTRTWSMTFARRMSCGSVGSDFISHMFLPSMEIDGAEMMIRDEIRHITVQTAAPVMVWSGSSSAIYMSKESRLMRAYTAEIGRKRRPMPELNIYGVLPRKCRSSLDNRALRTPDTLMVFSRYSIRFAPRFVEVIRTKLTVRSVYTAAAGRIQNAANMRKAEKLCSEIAVPSQ